MTRPLAVAALVVIGALSGGARAEGEPAVLVLPFAPDATVTLKQAQGATAQVRNAITPEVAKLLSSSNEDAKQAEKCARDVACLAKLAEVRGADLVGAGVVSPAADGLRVSIVVVAPSASALPGLQQDALRRVEITLQGNDGDARRLERFVRTAFNPSALRGWISVKSEEGALLEIDGVLIGALPFAPLPGYLEGDHVVVVRKEGSGEFRRSIAVVHGETSEVKAILVVSDAPTPTARDGSGEGIGTDVIVVGAIGAGLLVLGGVAGGLSLRDSLEIEERASKQNLAFPTDAELYQRGSLLALTANGLYVTGAIALGAAALLMVLE